MREISTVPGRMVSTGSRTAKVGCCTVGSKRTVSCAMTSAALRLASAARGGTDRARIIASEDDAGGSNLALGLGGRKVTGRCLAV